MSYDIYTGLLKAFPLPEEGGCGARFSYDLGNPNLVKLKADYPIEAVAGYGSDFSKAVNLLDWVSGHVCHKGDFNGSIAYNALDLLEHAFDKGAERGVNCVGLAAILSESLMSLGVKARSVFLMPCSPYDGDNHVVTHAYISEMRKWIMFDPTFNAYFINERGEYLSLFELRAHLADQAQVCFNNEARYNGDAFTEENVSENTTYFAKNLFYFQTAEISAFGNDHNAENRYLTLSPKGYDPKRTRLSNIEYRIRKYGDSPNMRNWLENARKEEYVYCSAKDFDGQLIYGS